MLKPKKEIIAATHQNLLSGANLPGSLSPVKFTFKFIFILYILNAERS